MAIVQGELSLLLVLLLVGATLISSVGVWFLRGRLDRPGQLRVFAHSLHVKPIPAGAGLILVPLFFLGSLPVVMWEHLFFLLEPLILMIPLAVLGWLDDKYAVPVVYRFFAQIIVAILGTHALLTLGDPMVGTFMEKLPLWVVWPVAVFLLTSFMNFFNFMDGSDGMSGITIFLYGFGLALFSAIYTGRPDGFYAPLGVLLMGLSLGFLGWNYPPARIFLGDSGSVSFGFILGILLMSIAFLGYVPFAIILSLYYWMDPGVTLVNRLVHGKNLFQPHTDHFFRKAIDRTESQVLVLWLVATVHVLLLCLALASIYLGWWTILPAGVLVVVFLLWQKEDFHGLRRNRQVH